MGILSYSRDFALICARVNGFVAATDGFGDWMAVGTIVQGERRKVVESGPSALKRETAKAVSSQPAFSLPNQPPHNGAARKGRCR